MASDITLQKLEADLRRWSANVPTSVGLESFSHLRDIEEFSEARSAREGVHFSLEEIQHFEQVVNPGMRDELLFREGLVLEHMRELVQVETTDDVLTLPYWFGCLTTPRIDSLAREKTDLRWGLAASDALASVLVSRTLANVRGAIAPFETPHVFRARRYFTERAASLLERPYARPIREALHSQLTKIEQGRLSVTYEEPGIRSAPATMKKTVIVHGTFAAAQTWWRDPAGIHSTFDPTENLWMFLDANGVSDLASHGQEFVWSGGHSSADRRDGAKDFINWWHTVGCPLLDVIAHSHGGNVVMLAMMMEPKIQVGSLVLLGTPASYEYVPRLQQTVHLHNVYSKHDSVQPVGAWITTKRGEGRTQSDGPTATNWHLPRLAAAGGGPVGHADLHHPDFWQSHRLVGSLLP